MSKSIVEQHRRIRAGEFVSHRPGIQKTPPDPDQIDQSDTTRTDNPKNAQNLLPVLSFRSLRWRKLLLLADPETRAAALSISFLEGPAVPIAGATILFSEKTVEA
jgi:hypothetical protein